jgi:hypothetical protein
MCAVTRVVFSALALPYDVVRPYSTRESLGMSVVQLIVACEDVTLEAVTPQMTGSIPVILRFVGAPGICDAATIDAALTTAANVAVQRLLEDIVVPSESEGPMDPEESCSLPSAPGCR